MRFDKRPRALLAHSVLLIVALAVVASATSTLRLPAVDTNGNGILTNVSLSVQPGTGQEYVDITPFFSVDTQQSSKSAVEAGTSIAGVDQGKYDYFIKIAADAEMVDGPSGGAALALLTYAEVTGKHIRQDMSMTGTINPDGSIGKVGGVYEKAQAAAALNIKLFLVPVGQAVQNGVDLTTYGPQQWGMQVIEVRNLTDVISLAFTAQGSTVTGPALNKTALVLEKLDDTQQGAPLKELAAAKISQARDALVTLEKTRPTDPLVNATLDALNQSQYQFDQGYYYSSANNAFLAIVALDASSLANASTTELNSEADNLEKQAFATQIANKTAQNEEWAYAAELRKYWVLQKLQDARGGASGAGDGSSLAESIAASSQWLSSVGDFNSAAVQVGGTQQIDETKLRGLAAQKISLAQNITQAAPDNEAVFHLNSARREFSDGAYLTAVIDADFAIAFTQAVSANADNTTEEAASEIRNSSYYYSLKSAWAQLYFAHALESKAEWVQSGDATALLNALKLEQLSGDIEQSVTVEIPQALSQPAPSASAGEQVVPAGAGQPQLEVSVVPQSRPPADLRVLLAAALAVILVGIALLLFALSRHSEKQPPMGMDSQGKLDKLDELLIEGKISEQNYERLRAKYSPYAGAGIGARGTSRKRSR